MQHLTKVDLQSENSLKEENVVKYKLFYEVYIGVCVTASGLKYIDFLSLIMKNKKFDSKILLIKKFLFRYFPHLVNLQTLNPLLSAVVCSELKNSDMSQLKNVWASHKCKKLKIDFQNHRRELQTFWNTVC